MLIASVDPEKKTPRRPHVSCADVLLCHAPHKVFATFAVHRCQKDFNMMSGYDVWVADKPYTAKYLRSSHVAVAVYLEQ